MLIVRLWHYIRGYVVINVRGRHLERFINLIHINNILIWDIIRLSSEEITAKIELSDYKKVREIADQLHGDIELIRKSGMTLWKWRLKTRRIFAGACIIVFLGLYIMSSLVLTVEVIGDVDINHEEIIEDLNKRGLKPWVFKASLDIDKIESEFLKEHKNIEFINIDFHGTKALVDLVEIEEPERIHDKSTPVDLIAKKDGIIRDILVVNGTANVEIGQEVKKGDLLIKGEEITTKIVGDEEETVITYLHAMGKVMAEINYQAQYDIRKYKVINEEDYKISRVFHLGDFVINRLNKEDNFYYDSAEEKKLSFLGIQLPIKVNKIKYYAKDNCVDKTEDELREEVISRAKREYRKIGQVQNIEIISQKEANNLIKFDVNVTLLEEISEEQMIHKED